MRRFSPSRLIDARATRIYSRSLRSASGNYRPRLSNVSALVKRDYGNNVDAPRNIQLTQRISLRFVAEARTMGVRKMGEFESATVFKKAPRRGARFLLHAYAENVREERETE